MAKNIAQFFAGGARFHQRFDMKGDARFAAHRHGNAKRHEFFFFHPDGRAFLGRFRQRAKNPSSCRGWFLNKARLWSRVASIKSG